MFQTLGERAVAICRDLFLTTVGGLSKKDTVTRRRQGLNIQISLICPFPLAVNVISKWPQSSVLHRRMKHHVGCTFAI